MIVPKMIKYAGGILNVEVRTPETTVASGELRSRGKRAQPALIGDSPFTACALCGITNIIATNGKPMKNVVLYISVSKYGHLTENEVYHTPSSNILFCFS